MFDLGLGLELESGLEIELARRLNSNQGESGSELRLNKDLLHGTILTMRDVFKCDIAVLYSLQLLSTLALFIL